MIEKRTFTETDAHIEEALRQELKATEAENARLRAALKDAQRTIRLQDFALDFVTDTLDGMDAEADADGEVTMMRGTINMATTRFPQALTADEQALRKDIEEGTSE